VSLNACVLQHGAGSALRSRHHTRTTTPHQGRWARHEEELAAAAEQGAAGRGLSMEQDKASKQQIFSA
jgi:hypothetical protein